MGRVKQRWASGMETLITERGQSQKVKLLQRASYIWCRTMKKRDGGGKKCRGDGKDMNQRYRLVHEP